MARSPVGVVVDLKMGHTYTNLLYHVVFSTKERRPLINDDLAPRLIQFTGGIIRERKGKLLAMNGSPDHMHLLGMFVPKMAVSDMVRDIKSLTSAWVRDVFPNLKQFAWQEGYSAFTVGKSNLDSAMAYIGNQQAHHKKKTFDEELIELLERAGIEYDPRYLFD